MKLNKSRFQQAARFELLPLIDVIFLLLIFFIFVMLKMTMKNGISIELPQTVASQSQTKEMLTISIDKENQIFINQQITTINSFLGKVIDLQNHNKLPILIRGDQQANLGIALSVLDELHSAGFEHVTFATEKINRKK